MGGASADLRSKDCQIDSAVDLPSSAFFRHWSGFRPTAFLSRTGVQGSVPHAAELSPCQPPSTCQGGNEVPPIIRAQATDALLWPGAHQRWFNFVCDAIVCDAHSSLSGSKMGAVEQRQVLETRRFK